MRDGEDIRKSFNSHETFKQAYTASAKEAGIVSGNQDGSFAVGTLIKRENMAVILYRVAESDINSNVSNEINFNEETSNVGTELGIIVGDGNGKYFPDNAVTMQQLYAILDKCIQEVITNKDAYVDKLILKTKESLISGGSLATVISFLLVFLSKKRRYHLPTADISNTGSY